jgi:hypothetical protein
MCGLGKWLGGGFCVLVFIKAVLFGEGDGR